MKNFILSGLIVSSSIFAVSQSESSMEQWKGLLSKPQLAEYFGGIFEHMGFVVQETGEEFTVHHAGDHFTIEEGINRDAVDYVVNLKLENIRNMKAHGDDSTISEYESFKIMSVLFTPLTEASLTNPTMSKPLMRKMSGIENHLHVNLISPDKNDTISHTLIYLNKAWMVVPGRHGNALRTFNLTQKDAIDYQKQVFIALKADNMKAWKNFKKWYVAWRKDVSDIKQ